MEIANIVLYVKTLLYCCKVKHEINKRKEVMLNEKGTKLQKEKEWYVNVFYIFSRKQMEVLMLKLKLPISL